MNVAGWTTVETASGKAYKYDDSQQSAFLSANSACFASSGLDEPIGPLPSAKESYRSMVNMHACLRQAGFDLGDPPSFQSFDDAGSRWTPYEEILVSDLAKAEQTCPQNGF